MRMYRREHRPQIATSRAGSGAAVDAPGAMSAFRRQSPESRHSASGPSKSRLLRALAGRSTDVRPSSKADGWLRLSTIMGQKQTCPADVKDP